MRALIVVPPLLRYLAGPLAGPATLAGTSPDVDVLDLNARWLRRFVVVERTSTQLVGDHAKPRRAMEQATAAWLGLIGPSLGDSDAPVVAGEDALESLWFSHAAIERAARALSQGTLGDEWRALLPTPAPHVIGVSILWSGQVVAALALAMIAREQWPAVRIIFGGAHVTALAPRIAADPVFGRFVDGYVAGYAEATFTAMLEGEPLAARGVFRAGSGTAPRADETFVTPRFEGLDLYGAPRLHLPAQASRGCAFGRCSFCTYPAQESGYRRLPWAPLGDVVELAIRSNAAVSVKDAYVVPDRLRAIGELIAGRCEWSACTRLVPRLSRDVLRQLDASGLRTIEVGVETLDPETLRRIDKRQSRNDLEALLDGAAALRIHLVLNTMFGFPGQSEAHALAELEVLERELPTSFADTSFSTERNLLQIQAHSPMGRDPARFGVRVLGAWPWSATLAWDAPAWRSAHRERLQGHHIEEQGE